jgi:K+-sensing histidine kinase KdpD
MEYQDNNIYVSKPKQEHFETFCLNELKHEMKIYTEKELEKWGRSHVKVETFTEYYTEKFWIHSDRKCLKQILSILLDNAVKHTDKGAILFDFQISSIEQFRDEISFFVDDTGNGIYNKNDLNYPIAEGLIKKLGGEMKITPSDDAGISVKFNIVCAPFELNGN